MAVYFTGCFATPKLLGNGDVEQALVAFRNNLRSGRVMTLRRMMVQLDPTGLLTTVMPVAKLYRATGQLTGGEPVMKGAFDTAQQSSPLIEVLIEPQFDGQVTDPIEGSVGAAIWQNALIRRHTNQMQVPGVDEPFVPLVAEKLPFKLYPGESVVMKVICDVGTSNPSTNNWTVNGVWQEEDFTTFAISGTVTLSGSPVQNAEVVVVVADDAAMTNAYLWEVVLTNASGQWSSKVPVGKLGFVYCNNESGGTFYTSPGRPFQS